MPFYDDYKKKKMSKADHLKFDARGEEEGARYRKSARQADEQRRVAREEKPARDNGRFGRPDRPAKGDFRKDGPKPPRQDRRFEAPREDRPPRPRPESKPERRFEAPRDINPYEPPENLLSGRNPIREAIKSGRDIEKLLVAKGDLSGTAKEIIAMAKEAHIPIQTVERSRLDEITRNHQGMLAFASAYRYYEVEDMLSDALEKGEPPFLIVLDGVTDPQNLGAVIRTAACVGAHGVIVPERRAVGLTPSAVKASAGAIEKIKVARVTNLKRTLDMLKEKGVWLYAADMDGEDYRKIDFSGPLALIVGAEGEGVSRLVLESSDYKVSLPMKGGVGSLNASVAAGVLMYAAFASRG